MLVKTDLSALYWKNWKFWYKLIAGLFTLAIFLAVFFSGIDDVHSLGQSIANWFENYPKTNSLQDFRIDFANHFARYFRIDWISIVPVVEGNVVIDLGISAGYGEYTLFFNSFFTNISNFLVALWFLEAALLPKKEGKSYYLGFHGTMIVTTYISMTMIVFTGMLVPVAFVGGVQLSWEVIAVGLFQHLIFPISLIVYVCFWFNPRIRMKNQKYMRRGWWRLVFWLLVYLAWTLLRGEVRYQGQRPLETQYPYFFMQIHNPEVMGMPGYAWLIVVSLLIIALIFGISILFNTIINKRITHQRKVRKNW